MAEELLAQPGSLLSKSALGLALAFALGPKVTTHASQAWAALCKLDLGVRSTEVSPFRAPLSTFYIEQLHGLIIVRILLSAIPFFSPWVGVNDQGKQTNAQPGQSVPLHAAFLCRLNRT